MQAFLNEGAKSAVADRMKACVEAANAINNTIEKAAALRACRGDTLKDTLKASLGKTEITDIDVEVFIIEGAKKAAEDAMGNCMSVANSLSGNNKTTAIAKCKSESVKGALEGSLGKEVTPIDVEEFVRQGAKSSAMKAMQAAMEVNGTADEKAKAAKDAAKVALAQSLESKVSNIEVNEFINEGAKDAVGDAMKACMESTTNITEQEKCRSTSAKDTLAKSLGKATVTQVDVELFIRKGAQEKAMEAMKASANVNGTSLAKRKEAAKEALKAALGKAEISNTKLEEFIEDGAKAAVKSAMSACAAAAESETDATAKQQKLDNCRSSSAREALSKALGKSDSNEVSKTEVEAFVRNAAKTAVADAMKAAMEDESTSEVEKRQAVKQALAQSLGQSEIDDTSLEFFKKKGAQDAIADTMKSCVEAAKLEATKGEVEAATEACAANSAKEALQTALGTKIYDADVNKFVQQGGKASAAVSRKNCMSAAGTDVTEQKKCSSDRVELIETIKESTGVLSVDDYLAEAYVLEGASGKATETVVACTSLAGSDTEKLNECKLEARNIVASLMGRDASTEDNTISEAEVEEVKFDGAAIHVMDMIKACYDGALGNETKRQECTTVNADTETSVKEALGKSSVTAVDVHHFNRMAQMQALATTNEALSSDTSTSNEEQNAQRKADMKALGMDVDAEPLKAHMFSKKVGSSKIARTALSCLKANEY